MTPYVFSRQPHHRRDDLGVASLTVLAFNLGDGGNVTGTKGCHGRDRPDKDEEQGEAEHHTGELNPSGCNVGDNRSTRGGLAIRQQSWWRFYGSLKGDIIERELRRDVI
jgi:hypothetical protein